MHRPDVGMHEQRPITQGAPPQQSELRVHVSSCARHWPHMPLTQRKGGQQSLRSSLGVHAPAGGMHIGRGRHTPIWQALGAQQSASVVHIASSGRHGGWHRPSRHVVGAQQSESLRHMPPVIGQGCQTR